MKKLILTIVALSLIACPISSLHAHKQDPKKEDSTFRGRRDRGGRVAGALGGAAVGGVVVGVAKSAKWAPLGIVGGGVAGYFLARAIQKGQRNKNGERTKQYTSRKNMETKKQ